MKVILTKDVKKVGKAGEVVNLADGYARNFIIAKGFGVAESKTSKAILDKQNEEKAAMDAKNKKEAEALKEKLTNITVEFKVKAGAGGRVFGAVSSKQVVSELKKKYDITVDKRKFLNNHQIQALGTTICKVDLYKNEVIGEIKVHLSEV